MPRTPRDDGDDFDEKPKLSELKHNGKPIAAWPAAPDGLRALGRVEAHGDPDAALCDGGQRPKNGIVRSGDGGMARRASALADDVDRVECDVELPQAVQHRLHWHHLARDCHTGLHDGQGLRVLVDLDQ